jgi:hypothetical protein
MGILLGALGGAGEGLATYAKGEQAKDSQLEIDKQRSQLEEEKAKRVAQFQQDLDISGIGKRSSAQLSADQAAQPTRIQMASTASSAANKDAVTNTIANANNQDLVNANLKKQQDEAAGLRQKAIDDAKAFADPSFIRDKSTATAADAVAKQTPEEAALKKSHANYYNAESAKVGEALKTLKEDKAAWSKIPKAVQIQMESLRDEIKTTSAKVSEKQLDNSLVEKDKDGKTNPALVRLAEARTELLNLAKTYSPKSDTPSANPFGLTDEPAKDPALKPAQKSPVAVKDPLSIEKEWITKRNGFTDEKDLKKFLKDNPDLSQKMKRATEELLQARTDATKNFQAGFETPL